MAGGGRRCTHIQSNVHSGSSGPTFSNESYQMQRAAAAAALVGSREPDINNGVGGGGGGEASLLDAFCFSTKINRLLGENEIFTPLSLELGIIVSNHEAREDAQRFSGKCARSYLFVCCRTIKV